MTKSKIEWTESTWNPVTGCTKISEGCHNCYAERIAFRLQAMKQPNYINGFDVSLHPHVLDKPLKWKKPRSIFVNSMSDLFHKDVPLEFIQKIFAVMNKAYWHNFQVLTKRADRMEELAEKLVWSPNIWMGVTIESDKWLHRADHLRNIPAAVRFLSMEPLLSNVPTLNLQGIDWVIVGGESGPGARPIAASWVRNIQEHCRISSVPFFFKQWGGKNKKKAGRLLDGRTWDETPNLAVAV